MPSGIVIVSKHAAISDPQTSMRLLFVSAAPADRRDQNSDRAFWLHRESLAVGSLLLDRILLVAPAAWPMRRMR
jgi:hypothetical protein